MLITCPSCGQTLPEVQFERYANGSRRGVCRHCHYVLHVRRAVQKWRMRQKAELLMKRYYSK